MNPPANPYPKKSFGQFFLRDRQMALDIASSLSKVPTVIEIGPGDGALTEALLTVGHNVTAVELDPVMVSKLERKFKHRRDIRFINSDFLKIDWNSLHPETNPISFTGNLPYHLTSPILFAVFDLVRNSTSVNVYEMVVMIQKEVAYRLTAQAGNKTYGSLTLLSQYHCSAEYLMTVPRDRFFPRPGVDGGVIRLTFKNHASFPDVDFTSFRRVVRGCFAQRRKILRNALCVVNDLPEGWADLPYDFNRRPEQLTLNEYVALTKDLLKLTEETSART